MWFHEKLTFLSSKKHCSNKFFIKCFPVYSLYVHLIFLYIFWTKLSRNNEKSPILLSRCQNAVFHVWRRVGVYTSYLRKALICISNFRKFSRHEIFHDLDFDNVSLFSRYFHEAHLFFTTLKISWRFDLKTVSRHFHRYMKFHDVFTTFAASTESIYKQGVNGAYKI